MKKMQPVKQKKLYFMCLFINYIALVIAVNIYYYLIKYRAKQKHLLPYYTTNNKLKNFVLVLYYKN